MFGFVMADIKELTPEEDIRYRQFYCGICRQMRLRHGSLARLGLSFDLAFLGLLLHSLYEPEEMTGKKACGMHPIKPRPWVDSEYIAYCADMNVALAYYKALDDQQDKEGKKSLVRLFGKNMEEISKRYPRQCKAMAENLEKIRLWSRKTAKIPICLQGHSVSFWKKSLSTKRICGNRICGSWQIALADLSTWQTGR